MKKNLYYRAVVRRAWTLQQNAVAVLLGLTSYPRMILEMPIRKNFGQRYFSIGSAIISILLFMILPSVVSSLDFGAMVSDRYHGYHQNNSSWYSYITWYIYLVILIYSAIKRQKEIKRNPSVYDFEQFTMYSGDFHSFFSGIEINGKRVDQRKIETLLEPALFFLVGVFLSIIGQKLGNVFIVCSILYSLSYILAYKLGDDYIMDLIDQMIMNEEMENAFVLGKPADQTRGVRFHAKRPSSEKLRSKVARAMVDEMDEAVEMK